MDRGERPQRATHSSRISTLASARALGWPHSLDPASRRDGEPPITRLRSRFQPGPALAAAVLIVALLALALIDRGPGQGSPPAPAPGNGPDVVLLPPTRGDAGATQYSVLLHRGGTLMGTRRHSRNPR
jgi:hypothetical protein